MASSTSIIKLSNITKNFNKTKALDDVSFKIPLNSIFGILGPNGSGKSTIMRILANLITEWDGNIFFNNSNLHADKNYLKRFGFIIESPCFYEYLSARTNLEILSRLTFSPKERIDELLDMVDLLDRSNEKVSHFSYGMKQRLGIAQALLHDPEILILDEPNNGLDPVGMNQIADIIFYLKEKGKTICISTHSLNDVDRLCSDVAILSKGKLLISDSMDNINSNHRYYRLEVSDIDKEINNLKKLKRLKIFFKQRNTILLSQHCDEVPLEVLCDSAKNSFVESISRESSLIEFFYV